MSRYKMTLLTPELILVLTHWGLEMLYDIKDHQEIACYLIGAKPLPEPMRTGCQRGHQKYNQTKFQLICKGININKK